MYSQLSVFLSVYLTVCRSLYKLPSIGPWSSLSLKLMIIAYDPMSHPYCSQMGTRSSDLPRHPWVLPHLHHRPLRHRDGPRPAHCRKPGRNKIKSAHKITILQADVCLQTLEIGIVFTSAPKKECFWPDPYNFGCSEHKKKPLLKSIMYYFLIFMSDHDLYFHETDPRIQIQTQTDPKPCQKHKTATKYPCRSSLQSSDFILSSSSPVRTQMNLFKLKPQAFLLRVSRYLLAFLSRV